MLCLFVRAGAERVAIPAALVVEVIPAVWLHPLAGVPDWVAGVFRFRGTVTPVIDLTRAAGGTTAAANRLNTRILVVDYPSSSGPQKLGLLAERVAELKVFDTRLVGCPAGRTPEKPDLGPLVADALGVVRVPDIVNLVPLAYRDALFGVASRMAP